MTFFSLLGAILLFLLKIVGILLAVVVVLVVLLLFCPFCADLCWKDETLTVRAGALGITFPVWQYPQPEPAAMEEPKNFWGRCKAKLRAFWEGHKRKKAAKKPAPQTPKKQQTPRKKAKLTLEIVCTMLRGAGKLVQSIFGALRITQIKVCLGVRGDDPAAAARSYGKLQAWLYPLLGVLDRFIYLQFDELRIEPDFGAGQPSVQDRVSCRISAQALFIVLTLGIVLYEFWRKKVLDVFL